jgi:hypothetical protein
MSLLPKVPAEERIILTALEKDRDLRYQSATDLRADLKRLKRDTMSGLTAVTAQPVKGTTTAQSGGASDTARQLETGSAAVGAVDALLRFRHIAAITVLLAALAVVADVSVRPLPLPKVTGYAQMTDDRSSKDLFGTDGVRLYYAEATGEASWDVQMAISGGEPARMAKPSASL